MRPGFACAFLLVGVAGLAACNSGAEGSSISCDVAEPGAARLPRACRLSAEGPFLSHESRAARPGDILMTSAFARFYITGTTGADGYVPFAGWVIDADMVRADGSADYDGIDGYYPVVNGAPVAAETVTIVNDGSDGEEAVVRVEGRSVAVPVVLSLQNTPPNPVPVVVTLTYALGPEDRALRVSTRVVNTSKRPLEVAVGDLAHFGDDEAEPFSLPGGFDLQSPAHTVDALGSSNEWRRGSYAVFPAKGQLALSNGSTVRDQVSGDDTSLWGYTLASETLARGGRLTAVRYLAVGQDVSTALSQRLGFSGSPPGAVGGRVLAGGRPVSGARISLFEDPELRVFVGQVLSGASGAFEVAVRPGRYHIVATGRSNGEYVQVEDRERELAEGFLPSAVAEIAVDEGGRAELDLELGQSARARIAVHDRAGQPVPAKVTFQADDVRPGPLVTAGERVPYASLGVRQIVWLPAGTAELTLEPGVYTVTASRGFDASVDVQRAVALAAGETTGLDMTVEQVVDHAGHVAIDSHVHGYYSQHGEATTSERVITAAAEGLRVHISTDHDWVGDYRPAVRSSGLSDRLLSVRGVELTTFDGHHCMWPLRRESTEARGGAALWWAGGTLDDWYRHYRDMGAIVRQFAHGAYIFYRSGYDPRTGQVDDNARFIWGFNAMEVHNGKGNGGREDLVPLWLSLINWGRRVAPLAVSDSHRRVPEIGSGRTYVRVGDRPDLDASAVARAVAGLKTVATSGPFIDLRARSGGGPGDTIEVDANGEVTLAITVSAPDWIPVDEVVLLRDGQIVERWDQNATPAVGLEPARAVWFDHELVLAPEADTWYAVEVRGFADLAPVYPGVQPWALTAPLFIDVDRDGRVEPVCPGARCAAALARGAPASPSSPPGSERSGRDAPRLDRYTETGRADSRTRVMPAY